MNKEEQSQQTALFRYSLIAPAVAEIFEAPSLAQHFRDVASKKHRHPDGRLVEVTCHSLERWYYSYKKDGLAGITPKARADAGRPKALSDSAMTRICGLREQFPYITGKAIYGKLVEEGAVDAAGASLATVHRFIRGSGLKAGPASAQEVRAFEMEFANDCWQSDASKGPVVRISGKKTQTHLFAFIDDCIWKAFHIWSYEKLSPMESGSIKY